MAGEGSKWVIIRDFGAGKGSLPRPRKARKFFVVVWSNHTALQVTWEQHVCFIWNSRKDSFSKSRWTVTFLWSEEKKKDWWVSNSRLGKKMVTRGQEDSLGKTLVEIGPEGASGFWYSISRFYFDFYQKNILWKCDFLTFWICILFFLSFKNMRKLLFSYFQV